MKNLSSSSSGDNDSDDSYFKHKRKLSKFTYSLLKTFFTSIFIVSLAITQFLFTLFHSPVYAAVTQVNPTADTFVENSAPTANYGTNGLLKVKQRGASSTRESYLRFDLSAYSSFSSIKLDMYGEISSTADTQPADLSVVGFNDNTWNENTVTWNTKPSVTGSPIANTTISVYAYAWFELDVTSYVNAQLAANNKIINLALVQRMNDLGEQIQFKSRETTDGNKPYLSLTTVAANQPPTLNFTEPSGNNDSASTNFTITWNDSDPDNNANISLYYDNDNIGANGILITKNIKEDTNGSSGSYSWDTSEIPAGNYYVYAVIDDGINPPVISYSPGYLSIGNNAPTGNSFGSIAGSFSVNDYGSATYNMPISISPGSGSLQPSLNIGYSNDSANSILGVGFSIGGLSTVSRCPATLGQDNLNDGVDFDANDKFCLDGERLILVNAQPYGGNGSEYKTEHETFSRIFYYTATSNSPDYFQVETKNGLIMIYTGILAQGKSVSLFWPISKVSDRNQNYMNFLYNVNTNTGEYTPQKIDYTGNTTTGLATYNTIAFTYEPRPASDVSVNYLSGSKSTQSQRLKTLESKNQSTTVYKYSFEYQVGNVTGKSHLTKITECGSDGSCFAPTTFSWDATTPQWGTFLSQTRQVGDMNALGSGNWLNGHTGDMADPYNYNNFIGDFDGDHKSDLLAFTNTIPSGKTYYQWRVAASTGTNFGKYPNNKTWDGHNGGPLLNTNPGLAPDNLVLGDFNNDGYTDMMKWSESTTNQWKVWLSDAKNGNLNFVPQANLWTGLPNGKDKANASTPISYNSPNSSALANVTNYFFTGDFDGDGYKDDVLRYAYPDQSSDLHDWQVVFSNGTSFSSPVLWKGHTGNYTGNFVGDFNGDGKDDIMAYTGSSGIWRVKLNSGSGFNLTQANDGWTGPTPFAGDDINNLRNIYTIGDFNGDKKSDIARYVSPNVVQICFSTGSTFNCSNFGSSITGSRGLFAGDFNGDGKSDLAGNPDGSGMWQVSLSQIEDQPVGDFSNSSYWGGNSAGIKNNIVGDFNNDGKADLAGWTGINNGDGTGKWHVTVSSGSAFVNSPTPSTVTYWNGPVATTDLTNIRSGDYNGDGRTDLISPVPNSGNWNLFLSKRDASGFDKINISNAPVSNINYNNIITGDFNGDGRTDIAGKSDTNSHWHVALSSVTDATNSSNFNFSNTGTGSWTGVNSDAANTIVADFNGDGKSDLAERDTSFGGRWRITLSTGTDFTDEGSGNWDGGPNVLAKDVVLGDFNGDGKADLAGYTGQKGEWLVALSTGTGFDSSVWTGGHTGGKSDNIVGDFNGDGLSDIAGYDSNLKIWHVALSTGKAFGGTGSGYWKGETGGVNSTIVADFTGDGKSDITAYADATNGWHVTAPDGMKPDLLSRITTGTNLSYEITYNPLTNTNVHTPDNDAAYPRYDFMAPLYVVSQYRTNDNLGTSTSVRSYDYKYTGAESNSRGRGFRGFRNISVTDNQNKLNTTTSYQQDHLYQMMPTNVVQKSVDPANSGALISVINYNPVVVYENSANTISFAYNSTVEQKYYEINQKCIEGNAACLPYKTILTTNTYSNSSPSPDDQKYGNITKVQIDYKNSAGNIIGTKLTANTYLNDTNSNWILGRLIRTNVTDSLTSGGQAAQTRSSAFTYFPNGQIQTEVIEPDDANLKSTKTYSYDTYGNISQTKISAANVQDSITKTVFDNQGRFVTSVIKVKDPNNSSLDLVENKTYDPLLGVQITDTDYNGLISKKSYDKFGRLVSTENPVGMKTQTYYLVCDIYCPAGAIYKVKTRGNNVPTQTKFYGPYDEELRSIVLNYNNVPEITDTVYDNQLRPVKKSDPFLSGETTYWNNTTYDQIDRPIRIDYPDSTFETSSYNGLTVTSVNRKNQQTVKINNEKDQLISSVDANSKSNTYAYDPRGNTIKVTDPSGNITQMQYDILDNKTQLVDPDTGTTVYQYNALSQLIKQTDNKGNSATNTYDVLGRKISTVIPEGTSTWEYDTAANGKGQISKVNNYNNYSEIYTYDNLSRPLTQTTNIDGTAYTYSYTYNAFGLTSTLTYPTGYKVNQVYNPFGQLMQVLDGSNNRMLWQFESSNSRNLLTQESYGNGIITSKTYDATNPYVKTISTGKATTNDIQNLSYNYDALGNLLSRTDNKRALNENFTYDNLNRLTQTKLGSNVTSNIAYDVLGNITSRSDVGTYNYTNRPHTVTSITGGTKNNTYVYDINGNRTSSNTGSIVYTSFDKPVSIKEGTNTEIDSYSPTLDKFKQILTSSTSTDTTIYTGGLYEKKTSVAGNTTTVTDTFYINAGDENFAVYTKVNGTGSIKYLHHDHLGSVETITDNVGNVVESQSYDAWGLRRNATNWTTANTVSTVTTKGFTSHEQLDDVNLINMKGRIYDPVIGKFTSADPTVQFPDFTQSLNRYSYVLNNPLSFTDPSGFGIKHWLKKHVGIVQMVVAALTVFAIGPLGFNLGFGVFGTGFAAGFASSFAGTVIAGGSFKDALVSGLKNGVISGLASFVTAGVNYEMFHNAYSFGNIVAHGIVGGVFETIQGGKFEQGFIHGAFQKIASPIGDYDSTIRRVISGAIIGGTESELTGNKFINGAASGAFAHLFKNSSGQSDQRNKIDDLVGKIWNLPNTAIGLVWGGIGLLGGGSVSYNSNLGVIEFTNHPWAGTAETLGDTISYSPKYPPTMTRPDQYDDPSITIRDHEYQHVMQGHLLGPLYLPSNLTGLGFASLFNFNSHGWLNINETGPGCHRGPQAWGC